MVFQSIATSSAELEYVSDRDGGFKRSLERCKLLTRWAFEYFDQTGELLPKSDILKSQLATSLEGRDESGNQRRNHAGMVPADRRQITFGARG